MDRDSYVRLPLVPAKQRQLLVAEGPQRRFDHCVRQPLHSLADCVTASCNPSCRPVRMMSIRPFCQRLGDLRRSQVAMLSPSITARFIRVSGVRNGAVVTTGPTVAAWVRSGSCRLNMACASRFSMAWFNGAVS